MNQVAINYALSPVFSFFTAILGFTRSYTFYPILCNVM